MEKIYYDVGKPGSLSGVRSLVRYSGQNENKVREFLTGQPAYTLYRPVRKKFLRRKIFAKGLGDLYQADIADMTNVSRYNDNERFLLVCIDVF